MPFTMYCQRVPTTDDAVREYAKCVYTPVTGLTLAEYIRKFRLYDVALRREPNGPIVARHRWDASDKPDRRYRWTMFNCFRYAVEWLPDAEGAPEEMVNPSRRSA